MPHQCVRCSSVYSDGATEILKGCKCGAKLFFFFRGSLEKKAKEVSNLTTKDKEQIETDIYDIMGNEIDRSKPVILDLECVSVAKPGHFEIDLVNLFDKKKPLVYKLEEGKYVIDIAETFTRGN